jgi:hypothetical protein
MEEEGLDAVLPVVRQSKPGELLLADQALEKAAPGLASICFKIPIGFPNCCRVRIKGNFEPGSQFLNEGFILVGLCSSQAMIHMGCGEFVAEFMESQQERCGVGST